MFLVLAPGILMQVDNSVHTKHVWQTPKGVLLQRQVWELHLISSKCHTNPL